MSAEQRFEGFIKFDFMKLRYAYFDQDTKDADLFIGEDPEEELRNNSMNTMMIIFALANSMFVLICDERLNIDQCWERLCELAELDPSEVSKENHQFLACDKPISSSTRFCDIKFSSKLLYIFIE